MGQWLTLGMLLSLSLFQSGSSLASRFDQIAQKAQGRVGAAVMLIENGDCAGIRMEEKFPMASVFKLPVGMAVLHRIDQGRLALDRKVLVKKSDFVAAGNYSAVRDRYPEGNAEISVRELLRLMMVVSDGTACDVLLRLAGGPASVTEYLKSLGVNELVVAVSQKEMSVSRESQNRNWATPTGAVQLLRTLHQSPSISRSSRSLLLQFMAECETGPQRIRGLLPQGTVVSHKTGSLGAQATNDVGIVTLPDGRKLAVAVFVSDSRAGETARERVIAEIARAAWDHYLGK